MIYKNLSRTAKTFHNVTFQPGETKEVPSYINHPRLVPVDKSGENDVLFTKQEIKKVNTAKSNKEAETDGTNSDK